MPEPIITSSRDELQKLASYRKGYIPDPWRPVFLHHAIEHGVITDGFVLIENQAATNEVIGKWLQKEQNKEVKQLLKNNPNLSQPEAAKVVKERFDKLAKEGTFPNYKALYNFKLGDEARLVGIDKDPERNQQIDTVAYVSDGKNITPVNADKLAFVLKHLPNAKMVLAEDRPSTSPITFMVNDQKKGLLMPLFIREFPGAIKDAATRVKTQPIEKTPEAPKPTPEAKEPWKMTLKERLAGVEGVFRRHGLGRAHEEAVKEALKAGKPVPAEVLKDYPELGLKPPAIGDVSKMGRKELLATRDSLETFGRENRRRISDIDYAKLEKTLSEVNLAIARLPETPAKPEPKAESREVQRLVRNDILVHLGGSNRLLDRQLAALDKAGIKAFDAGSIGTGHWSNRHYTMADTPETRALIKQIKGSIPRKQWPHLKSKVESEPERQGKAEAHRWIAKTKPEPKKEIAILQPKPGAKQSDRAIAIDRALLAKQVVSVDDPRWLRRPNRFDVRGVDTPGSGRVTSRTGFADKGKTRMSRKHHRGWKRIKL